MFLPQHLIWIAPFFLGGLLYSWLLQKTTERAVGISALGIHLSKGQTLILWDEIKEVRPLKFLHVRNLWLISESREKTLMHWTPLERHPDLNAAVESFAPANHPIRKYLSLLKPESPNKSMWTKIIVIVSVLLASIITVLLGLRFVQAQAGSDDRLRAPKFDNGHVASVTKVFTTSLALDAPCPRRDRSGRTGCVVFAARHIHQQQLAPHLDRPDAG